MTSAKLGVAAEADDEQLGQARIVDAVRRRIGWLMLLFFGGSITRRWRP